MTSSASPSLLSLTGKVEDILLAYVSAGEGGAQNVLNLRQVCSTTKLWVDNLHPSHAKQIVSSRRVKKELNVERLKEFLATPPSSAVTSLCLSGADNLSDHRFPPENDELWSRFVIFWTTAKLESLKVDVLFLPLNLKLRQLLSLASLRSLHCETIKQNVGKPTELPESLFRFKTLHVRCLQMGDSQKREFFSRLSSQQNLKHLIVKIEDKEGLTGLVDLIERKKDAEDFKLSCTVDPEELYEIGDGEPEMGRLEVLFVRLATSVANSSALIRIRGVRQEMLETVSRRVDRETAQEFFESIVEISCGFFTAPHSHLRATDFPDLETYTLTSTIDDFEYLETLDATAFPPCLRNLQVEEGFPRTASLPSTLVHLDIMHYCCSANKLLQNLISLAEECPSLRNLKLNWDYRYNVDPENDPCYGFQSLATSPRFKDLRSLDFSVKLHESDISICQMILLYGFKLPLLSLFDLKLAFVGHSEVVNHIILIALNSTFISKSLLNVDIDPRYVLEDARPLLESLKSTAAANKRKRVETHGKERERQFNR